MKKRVALHTLGCKANQADETFLAAQLLNKGYEIVPIKAIADYYIFNTCTVTDEADKEARRLTRKAKRHNPAAQVIVTGCYAQTQADAVAALPSVDAVIGNAEKENIANLLPTVGARPASPSLGGRAVPLQIVSDIRSQEHVPSTGRSHLTKQTRAQVKIQDGCNKFCSFCIIPYARGKNRSVPAEQIINELHQLHAHGFQEAVLTGIHIGTYGLDQNSSFEQLLQLIELEKPIPRVRLSSLDPEEVTDRLIDVVNQSDIICPHWHIAVQSGDNMILDRMRRRYHVDHFYHVVDRITAEMPHAAIGTDIIVGFPGESEEQFARTCRMVEDLPISYVHVFPYSQRKGTPATRLEGQVDTAIKKARSRELNAISRAKRQRYYESFIGQTVEVVVETQRDLKENLLKGLSPTYIPIHFNGDDALMQQRLAITIDHVQETRVHGHVA